MFLFIKFPYEVPRFTFNNQACVYDYQCEATIGLACNDILKTCQCKNFSTE